MRSFPNTGLFLCTLTIWFNCFEVATDKQPTSLILRNVELLRFLSCGVEYLPLLLFPGLIRNTCWDADRMQCHLEGCAINNVWVHYLHFQALWMDCDSATSSSRNSTTIACESCCDALLCQEIIKNKRLRQSVTRLHAFETTLLSSRIAISYPQYLVMKQVSHVQYGAKKKSHTQESGWEFRYKRTF